jgi:hypothetical protein
MRPCAGAFGAGPFAQRHHELANSAIAKIQRLCASLIAVAEHSHLARADEGGIEVSIEIHSHGP